MNNQEKITEAARIGWSAVLQSIKYNYQVLFIGSRGQIMCRREGEVNAMPITSCEDLEDLKIPGYVYAGQLIGNEPIPDGQRFRVRASGEILAHVKGDYKRVDKIALEGKEFFKSQLEPVFD